MGTKTALVTRADSSRSSTATASNSLTRIVVAPWESPRNVQPIPPMWNIGSGVRLDGRRVEAPGRDVERRRRQVALRGQHPLGHARGPRRVHLHHRVRGLPAAAGVRGLGGHQPSLVVLAHTDDLEPLRDAGGDGGGDVGERRPRDQHRGARVGDDGRQLGRRQAPVQRHGDGPDLAHRDQQLDHLRRTAVQVRDPRPRARAGGQKRLGQPVRALVELRVGERAIAMSDRDGVRTRRSVLADDVRDPELVEQLR